MRGYFKLLLLLRVFFSGGVGDPFSISATTAGSLFSGGVLSYFKLLLLLRLVFCSRVACEGMLNYYYYDEQSFVPPRAVCAVILNHYYYY